MVDEFSIANKKALEWFSEYLNTYAGLDFDDKQKKETADYILGALDFAICMTKGGD